MASDNSRQTSRFGFQGSEEFSGYSPISHALTKRQCVRDLRKKGLTWRDYLTLAGFASNDTAGMGTVRAFQPTDGEKANLRLIEHFCASFSSLEPLQIASFLGADCIYGADSSNPTLTGRDAVIDRIRGYVDCAESVEFKILQSYVRGSVVLSDRVETIVSSSRTHTCHVIGLFQVKGGSIVEWDDYLTA